MGAASSQAASAAASGKRKRPLYAAAVDPGLVNAGVACVEWDGTAGSKPRVLLATVIVPAATCRWGRLEEMVDSCVASIRGCCERYDVVAIENYVAFAARSWSAHDTLMVVGALVQREKWDGTGAQVMPTATAQVVRRWLTARAKAQGRAIDVAKNDKQIASEVATIVEWACEKPDISVRNHAIDAIALALYSLAKLPR